MLEGGRHHMTACAPGQPEGCQIISLGSAAGEDDFLRFGSQHYSNLLARCVEHFPRSLTEVMNTGSVAVHFGHYRKHGFQRLRRHRCGGVVIEVESRHGLTTILACRLEELPRRRHSRPNILLAVRRRHKSRLELRGCDVYAAS